MLEIHFYDTETGLEPANKDAEMFCTLIGDNPMDGPRLDVLRHWNIKMFSRAKGQPISQARRLNPGFFGSPILQTVRLNP